MSSQTSTDKIKQIVKESTEPLTLDLCWITATYTLRHPKRNFKDICAIIVIWSTIPIGIVFALTFLFGSFIPPESEGLVKVADYTARSSRQILGGMGVQYISNRNPKAATKLLEVVNKSK